MDFEKKRYSGTDRYGDRYILVTKSKAWRADFASDINRAVAEKYFLVVETRHAQKRMLQRKVDHGDIVHVLMTGEHKETRIYEKKSSVERHVFWGMDPMGLRNIEVVFVIEGNIIVVTVWSQI